MAEDILIEEGLPATTPRYQFQGIKQCLRCFELELERYNRDGQPSDHSYIIFDHVDERSYQKYFEDDSGESLIVHSLVTYNFISHVIVLKMPTTAHEAAHRAFSEIFSAWHRSQEGRLFPMGGATIEGFTRKKCPDSSWTTSIHTSERENKWPTILIESGWSDSRAKLSRDVLFWLTESDQQVRVALTMKVTHKGKITIDRWTLDETAGRTSVHPTQTMSITRSRTPNSNNHRISGSMHIKFEDCFLRDKRNSESDFILSNQDLTEIAEAVWEWLAE